MVTDILMLIILNQYCFNDRLLIMLQVDDDVIYQVDRWNINDVLII